jgi:Flp pilus assembly pilin Flp
MKNNQKKTRLLGARKGASLVEYGMIVGLISIASIGAVVGTGEEVENTFCVATNTLNKAISDIGITERGVFDCDVSAGVETADSGAGDGSGNEDGTGGGAGNGEDDGGNDTPSYSPPYPEIKLVFEGSTAIIHGAVSGEYEEQVIVDWGDGTIEPLSTGISHNYLENARYTVTISPGLENLGNCQSAGTVMDNLVRVESFGDGGYLTGLPCLFYGNGNIEYAAAIPPTVTSLTSTFLAAPVVPEFIESWDVSNVTDFTSTFQSAQSFDADITGWDTSSAVSFASMFQSTPTFNQTIGNWETPNLENIGSMFRSAGAFTQDLNWITPKLNSMRYTFYASAYNGDISNLDVSNVVSFQSAIRSASSFEGKGGMHKWETGSAVNMDKMFMNAASFSDDISGWCTLAGVSRSGFGTGSALPAEHYPLWGQNCD